MHIYNYYRDTNQSKFTIYTSHRFPNKNNFVLETSFTYVCTIEECLNKMFGMTNIASAAVPIAQTTRLKLSVTGLKKNKLNKSHSHGIYKIKNKTTTKKNTENPLKVQLIKKLIHEQQND